MFEANTTTIGITGTANTYSENMYVTPLNGGNGTILSNGSGYTSISTAISNSNNMRPTQVKVAVFEITRDEDTNEINSTKFLKELWVEVKNGASIDLIVAKHLDKDFNPETTIIKVLTTVTF